MKKRFESYDKEFQLLANVLPMLVSVTKNPDEETDEQFITTHDRFIALDETTKDRLASPKTATIIQNIGKVYNLALVQMSDISRAIRSYYFGELKLEDFSFALAKEMNIDLAKARQIFQVVKERIIDDNSYERAAQAELTNLPLSEALRIYPEVGEQLITSSKISLRNFPYPVRPSIKNWLADYTFNLGYEKHESMARSQYLFQGANTKNLPASEKEKLAYLLKSFDENFPITVNKNTKQVVFSSSNARSIASADRPAINPAGKSASNSRSIASADRPASNATSTNPAIRPDSGADSSRTSPSPARPAVAALPTEQKNINSMQFSYRQKLPYEKSLSHPAPAKTLSPSTPSMAGDIRGAERISSNQPEKIFTPPTPATNFPRESSVKPEFWKIPDNKMPAPPIQTKNLPREILTEGPGIKRIQQSQPSHWRLPGKPIPPQNIPKNVVDLKSANQQ